jgi:D-amino-acid oxidase
VGNKSILVLGCGVSGLSTGITLLRAGHTVTIWARELPPNTTSNQAAAIWWPYLCFPREKAIPWAKHSLGIFKQGLVPDPASGCALTTVRDLYTHEVGEPWWSNAVDRWQKLAAAKLPAGYVDGYEVESVVIDTSVYMSYLVTWFLSLGGMLERREVNEIGEALEFSDTVVNCTGLGSRKLFADETVYPVRGQIVKVKPNGCDEAIFDDEGPNAHRISC